MTGFSRPLKFLCLSAALILGACASKQPITVVEPPAPPPPPAAAITEPTPVTPTILAGSAEDFRVNVGDTVHFDFDKYNVADAEKTVLDRQAAWLVKYPAVRVVIEGHADERGTREYNLALGARRATAVMEYLASQGVSSGRIETFSYGKERPVCTDSNEACWAQNRRGVTVISAGAVS